MVKKQDKNINYLLFLSVVAAIGGFLFGYDTAVISGTISQVTTQFVLSVSGQGWYVGCALIGSILGASIAGILSDWFGRKTILMLSAILFIISAIGCAISASFNQLVISRMVGGMGIGIVSIVSPLYISEISIPKYRGSLVSLYQLAITIGFLGAYLVNYALLSIFPCQQIEHINILNLIFNTELWRGMLGIAILPAIMFIIVLLFIPESPRWLLLKGREPVARTVLSRIYKTKEQIDTELYAIHQIISSKVKTDWFEFRKPRIIKLVVTGAAIAILGQFLGVNAVLYYGPAIFRQNGMSDGDSLFYQVLIGLVNMLTTCIGLLVIDRVGRKKLIYFGVTGMLITLIGIGFYFLKGDDYGIPSLVLLILFLAYILFCAISICLVVWVLLSEIYPIKIRGGAMSVAGIFLWLGTYLIGQLTPSMLEICGPGGTFLCFAAICIPYILIVRYLIPETTGKSLEDIERGMNE